MIGNYGYENISPEAIKAMGEMGWMMDPIKLYFRNNISSMTKEEIDLFSYNLECELSIALAEERLGEACRRMKEKRNKK